VCGPCATCVRSQGEQHSPTLRTEQSPIRPDAVSADVIPQNADKFRRDRHRPLGLTVPALEPTVIVEFSRVGPLRSDRGLGACKREPAPSCQGKLAVTLSQRYHLAGAHHRVIDAREECDHSRAAPRSGVTHGREQFHHLARRWYDGRIYLLPYFVVFGRLPHLATMFGIGAQASLRYTTALGRAQGELGSYRHDRDHDHRLVTQAGDLSVCTATRCSAWSRLARADTSGTAIRSSILSAMLPRPLPTEQ
jgi:hypothetical protein